jgi:hypothetical protein
MNFAIPPALRLEHEELENFLTRANKEPGELGEAACLVSRLARPHFLKEEKFALPALGLLPALARGDYEPAMGELLAHTDWLAEHLGDLLAEHKAIVAALERLLVAARAANRPEYIDFAESLMIHAAMEEQVLYPAAVLVGEYLKLKLPRMREAEVRLGMA